MVKQIHNNLIEQASRQILSEFLGFEEGQVYYLLLTKNEQSISKEFSYSKRYRLLKRLYEAGAVGKLKPESQDFFNYFLLPPSFLYFNDTDQKIIDFLELIYLKNHSNILETSFTQIILRNEQYLLIFMLKYFMKEKAKLVMDGLKLNEILGKNKAKVNIIINKKESKRRLGTIDNRFAFEFFSMQCKDSMEYIGYFINNLDKNKFIDNSKDHISRIENEISGFC